MELVAKKYIKIDDVPHEIELGENEDKARYASIAAGKQKVIIPEPVLRIICEMNAKWEKMKEGDGRPSSFPYEQVK